MQWLTENVGTLAVLLIVATVTALAIFSVIRNKKKGGCSCGCGCNGCPMAGKCHSAKAEDTPQKSTNGNQP